MPFYLIQARAWACCKNRLRAPSLPFDCYKAEILPASIGKIYQNCLSGKLLQRKMRPRDWGNNTPSILFKCLHQNITAIVCILYLLFQNTRPEYQLQLHQLLCSTKPGLRRACANFNAAESTLFIFSNNAAQALAPHAL